ncbi:MAG: hypothetical protein JWM21_2855 [Acidobacteria bacterium]|nr:hypothetical protein [Acidobacteriota bacterium]
MSQPEIFRRCAHCGASSKPGELFCAQCGQALVTEKIEQTGEQNSLTEESDPAAPAAKQQEQPEAADSKRSPNPILQRSEDGINEDAVPSSNKTTAAAVNATVGQNPGLASQRVGLAARRGMADRGKPRPDKPRRVSSVVLNEAAYDPGIRFILVVGVLFVLFIVLLLLSKWIV